MIPVGKVEFEEIQCVIKPASAADVDEPAYYSVNPDVKRAGMPAREHFVRYGQREGRVQWVNEERVKSLKERKIRALRFRREPSAPRAPGECVSFISRELARQFDLPETPPISANQYGEFLNQEFRDNPDKLYLDLGAGLRHRYFSNVINTEIYPSLCIDVVCLGEDLPFEDETFDQVMSFAVLEHTRRPWDAAREMCRVLKRGGTLINDYPFLQPLHGYPHHYFNATPQGHVSLFEQWCDVQSVNVYPNQTPIYTLRWIAEWWKNGLSAEDAAMFEKLRIKDLLARPPEGHAGEPYCANLRPEVQHQLAAGTTLRAVKRA